MRVPVRPAMPSPAFSSSVMRAVRPGLLSANSTAACTLGSMDPGGKLSVRHILAGCLGRQLIQPLNIRFAKMDGNLLHGREDNQAVGIQLAGQATGGKIFVNDRRRTAPP